MTPDGHGGSLRALNRSGAIATMRAMGVEVISYFQVDNPLVQIIDPAFIGFHVLGKSEMSSKMIPKAYPLEKVGHFCIDQGRMTVVEYSDLPQAFQEQRRPSGELRFISGSIAIHIFDVGFVERIGGASAAQKLPFHKAVKKIPYLDEAGNTIKPEQANGVKFEMFVFDALPFAQNPVLIETLRDEDFSPVKNAEGVDSPKTCRRDQLKLWAKWLDRAGVTVPCDAEDVPTINFEVAPSFACDAEGFVAAWKQLPEPRQVDEGTVLA
jgi:UDP-N-acetylglucosamine/UDP-N-acetylgalactosamine diphosphorylase